MQAFKCSLLSIDKVSKRVILARVIENKMNKQHWKIDLIYHMTVL